ncbi:protein TolR [Thalassomonas sp. M1454]|uniref:protein TolR n=1 Tax=Thalassomonas sp. M1454 TaxID=2594477 RepID=UPI00117E59EA|nr:protein TolR [Thalassomonas sp. M1454]TRX56372.1 protein TolR [Thalassomonas sp. M1454]
MYVRVKRKRVAEINVVPYIDVMLVLLIIFMVTAPLITQGVKVDLPKADAQAMDQDTKPPLVASVDIDGKYYLNVGDSKSDALEPDELATLVAARLTVDPDTPVVVNGDGNVSYNSIIQLMVLLQNAGVPSVGLMTDSPES